MLQYVYLLFKNHIYVIHTSRSIVLFRRLRAHFPDDENADMVKSFNEGMRSYFASEGQASDAHKAQHTRNNDNNNNMCAHVNYVDVYNMTAQLALNHSDVAPQLTYDSVHWGKEKILHLCSHTVSHSQSY